MLRFVSIGLLCLAGANMALMCYESDPQTGTLAKVNKAEYTYCALIPRRNYNASIAFGVGPLEDVVSVYDATFRRAITDDYNVLSLCIYERHDFLVQVGVQSEYMFRCVCNTDLCNAPSNFNHFFETRIEVHN